MTLKKITQSLLISGAATASALGDTVTTTDSISATLFGFNDSMTFDKFDPALGTLTGVEIIIQTTTEGIYTLTNSATSGSATYGTRGSTLFFDYQLDAADVSFSELNSDSQSIGSGSIPAGNSVDFPVGPGSVPLVDTTSYFPTNLGDFIGAAMTFDMLVDADILDAVSRQNSIDDTSTISGALDGSVIYTYTTPIPEPSNSILAGFCLIGGLMFRRRH